MDKNEIIKQLNKLTDEQRYNIFRLYCRGCGSDSFYCKCKENK